MTVTPVSTATAPPTITVVTSSLASLRQNVLSAVAGTVNTSVAELQGRLRGGQSLSDVARTSGVSRPELLATVQEALSVTGGLIADLPQDKVVQRIVDHRQKVPRVPSRPEGSLPANTTGTANTPDVVGTREAHGAGAAQGLGARVDLKL
jgi:hypothetical protein